MPTAPPLRQPPARRPASPRVLLLAVAVAVAALCGPGRIASAQANKDEPKQGDVYPSRPVRIIVPSPPGGGTDIVARVLAQHFSNTLKQQFFVENRPGASGNIGAVAAARAPADGYTLLIGSSTVFP